MTTTIGSVCRRWTNSVDRYFEVKFDCNLILKYLFRLYHGQFEAAGVAGRRNGGAAASGAPLGTVGAAVLADH